MSGREYVERTAEQEIEVRGLRLAPSASNPKGSRAPGLRMALCEWCARPRLSDPHPTHPSSSCLTNRDSRVPSKPASVGAYRVARFSRTTLCKVVSSGLRREKVGGLPPGQIEAGGLASGIGGLADTSHGFRPSGAIVFQSPGCRPSATPDVVDGGVLAKSTKAASGAFELKSIIGAGFPPAVRFRPDQDHRLSDIASQFTSRGDARSLGLRRPGWTRVCPIPPEARSHPGGQASARPASTCRWT